MHRRTSSGPHPGHLATRLISALAPGTLALTLALVAMAPGHVAGQQVESLPGLDPQRALTEYGVDVWGEREGLPQNFVSTLAQTPDGYLWLGAERGLVRFDGVRFTTFTAAETEGLSSSWVRSLAAAADGTLWIGTGGGGLVRLRDGTFESFGTDEGLPGTTILSLLLDPAGRLWIGTEGNGLARMDPDESIRTWDADNGLSGDFVTALAADSAGSVWVATSGGLDRLAGDEIRTFGLADGLDGTRVLGLDVDASGRLWAGTASGGLFRFEDPSFESADSEGILDGALISNIRHDRGGTLWIPTNGTGLFRYHQGRIDQLDSGDGLPSNLLWDVLEDQEGHLWLGANAGGVIRLRDGLFTTLGAPEGLAMEVALALLEDGEGNLWIGTPGGGVTRFGGDGQVRTFSTADGLGNDIVLSLAEGDNGDIWVGMAAGGTSRISGDDVVTFGPADGVAGPQVTVTHVDRTGAVWLGVSGAGVQRWQGGEPLLVGPADGLPAGTITTILEDASGRLWVGTRDGLGRIDLGDDGMEVTAFGDDEGLPSGGVNSLWEDDQGSIWVAAMGGLARIGPDDVIARPGPGSGLPEPEPMAVMGDDRGDLWITSTQGVARVGLDELRAVLAGDLERVQAERFGRADGLRSAEANGGIHPAIWKAADGAIWFPTMQGAVRLEPEAMERQSLPPRPVLETVLVGGEAHSPARPIALPPGERTLEFQFSAPTFVAPRELSFRYRLEGFEDEWVEPRDRRAAFYTNLPPKTYTFRVQAADRNGNWSPREATLDVTLEPHVWERGVVQLAGGLALLLLAVTGYRWRIRTLQDREDRLVRLVEERERTETALRRSEERLRLALEAGRMGIWEWRPDAESLVWSEGMDHLFGTAPDNPADLVDHLVTAADPADRKRVRHELERIRHGAAEFIHIDFSLAPPPELETKRRVELRGRWIREGDGTGQRIVGVAGDVTALIEAQQALRAREEELRQSQKMEAVGRLAGGIAHDFNNILAVIGGNSRLALDSLEEGHPVSEELEEVIRAGDRAAGLTQQLLAFGRKQVLQPQELDLNEVVRGIHKMLGRLIRVNIELELRLEPGLQPIHADKGSMEQVLLNLVLNAQDAMPDGGTVTVATTNGRLDANAEDEVRRVPHVTLRVTDTGHGMDAATRERIFEPFFTTKELDKGTGLGLATVYGIIQQTGGSIETSSQPGEGATFLLRFPSSGEGEDDAEGEGTEVSPGAETEDQGAGTEDRGASAHAAAAPAVSPPAIAAPDDGLEIPTGGRVLLVEDSADVRSVTRRILERAGLHVVEAGDGESALEMLAAGAGQHPDSAPPVDLVLTDLVMPGVDGMTLARQVRSRWNELPILLMSGHAKALDRDLVEGTGPDGSATSVGFISKPFAPEDLTALVTAMLESRTR